MDNWLVPIMTYCIECKNINEKICTPFSTELLKLDTFEKWKHNHNQVFHHSTLICRAL